MAQREFVQNLRKTKNKQPFCTWVTTTRFQLQMTKPIRSTSNESEENNYKHKDLFTKHKLKQQTLRVKDQKCEL